MSNSQQLQQEKPLLVDFKQERATEQIFSNPPLIASYHSGWDGIYFEHHQQPNNDTCEHCLTMHTISVALDNISSERWLDGKRKSEKQTQGTIAIIPVDIIHRCLWEENIEFMFVSVDPLLVKRLGMEISSLENIELIPHFATQQDPLILGILFSLKDELESKITGDSLYVEQLKTMLVIHLLKKYCVKNTQIVKYSDGLPKYKLRQVLEHIHSHLNSEIKLAELASLAGISQYYFCQLFKNSLGITPYQYVLQQRVEQAKQLLRNGQIAICDIALMCGFANQSHLTKHFRKITGMTPKDYQKH
ncbi:MULTISPECIES: helix-turn-helix transcriptional regulator [Nostocales]|uniref:Helix-turn-helix transcriptional regulator n=3 Tax=Nostocales TaxID=1161 RepID=A0A0C1RFP8_9CYAN|nr:AraC family transcriptional regulator [Tolypothrix bouteillei]KAF3886996.1 helix-turn-helix transcriptional regulator [Tolypothrix bouteillei VB521301]